jgi:hypothetical protein
MGAVSADDEQFSVGLRSFRKRAFVLESSARTAEHEPFPVRRPRGARVTRRVRQPVQPGAARPYEIDSELLIVVAVARECNPIARGRPLWKIVPLSPRAR